MVPAVHRVSPEPWRPVEMDAGRVSMYSSFVCDTWKQQVFGYGSWHRCSRLPHSKRSAGHVVPFLQECFSRWYGSESPRVLSRLCPHSIDIRRSHQSGGAGRNHVQARVCLRLFLHQRGPAHVHVFLWLRGGVRGHSALRDGVLLPEVCHRFYFLKYVITDALNYGSAPDPLRGSRGDGHVASSLCASLLPAQRDRPGRWCTLLRLSHRCVQFPTVQHEVFVF